MGRFALLSAALAATASASTVTVDPKTQYQEYDGTGISEAFQRSLVLHELGHVAQKQALDLLFTETGAGFTILRNGIGSTNRDPFDYMLTIAPNKPATNATNIDFIPFHREDEYQIWLSSQARSRGVHTIYANAWSADAYMKTNNDDFNGGYLCGTFNASCATGDWRTAYANKLVRYLNNYKAHGYEIDFVNFLNEPDYTTPYASMLMDGHQTSDFLDVFGPILAKSGLSTKIACCDNTGWKTTATQIAGLQQYGGDKYIDIYTSHGYTSAPGAPLNTTKKVWQSEWSTFDTLNYQWYNASAGSASQSLGLTWANHIQSAFSYSNVTGFLYWWGAANSTDNEPLIFVNGTGDASVVTPTKRLFAHSHWGKALVRQGAHRVGATIAGDGGALNVTAFANTDGSYAVQVINNGNTTQTVTLAGLPTTGTLSTILTNEENDLTAGTAAGSQASIPAKSLLSFVYTA